MGIQGVINRIKILLLKSFAVIIGAVAVYYVSARVDLFEKVVVLVEAYEEYDIDELIILAVYIIIVLLVMQCKQVNIINKNRKELEISNRLAKKTIEEKIMLIRENNHRMMNNITMIEAFINTEKHKVTISGENEFYNQLIGKIHVVKALYDKLTYSETIRIISLKEYIIDIVDSLKSIYSRNGKVTIQLSLEDIKVDTSKATSIGIIINEIVTNSYKYGFKDGLLELSILLSRSDDRILLEVRDGGRGFPDNITDRNGNSLGFTIINSVARQMNAEIAMENMNGAKTTLIVDLCEKDGEIAIASA
ncbi:MAG: sensor histidine kinase [Spirochaetes bacterium]|nr:sensor histidine kinase [Spirochaetota bacterium]MBU1081557.1 sensor histidine kinase [Spirochaetota bacterium]